MDRILYFFFNFPILGPYWGDILSGFAVTVAMAVATVVIGIPLGLGLAVLRLYRLRLLNAVILVFVDVFRAIPQLVIIALAFFALPYMGLVLDPVAATVLALALVLTAFSAEIFRAAIDTVSAGQWEAGRASGLGFHQTLFHIILPQAVRLSIPPLTNRAIGISKGTTLGSVIAVPELLNVISSVQSTVANPTALTAGAVLFIALFLPFVRVTRWIERRFSHPGH